MKYDKVDALIASWQPEILETLKRWIAVPSLKAEPSADNAPFGTQLRRMLDLFLADAAHLGFAVDDVDGFAGSAQLGRGERTMGILAHLDIVPAGDGWTYDPFDATAANGNFYGRGVVDDKGPALGALYAMRAVREAGIPLKDGVRLIVGCDEETGMTDMAHYTKTRDLPDYGFSPDGAYPLINIEKGGLSLRISKATGGETGAKLPVYALYAGVRQNVVPGAAFAEVGTDHVSIPEIAQKLREIEARHPRFKLSVADLDNGRAKIESIGAQAHASTPDVGFNAAGALLVALAELGAGGGSQPAIAALSKLIGVEYDGAALGIRREDALSGPLTCNLGLLRYDENVLWAQLDIRYPLCAEEIDLCGNVAMALSPYELSVCRTGGHVPLHVPAESDIVRKLIAIYNEMTGEQAKPIAIGGGTYSRTMPQTVAFGPTFPQDGECCHMPDEHFVIEHFMLSVRIMARAIAELAGA